MFLAGKDIWTDSGKGVMALIVDVKVGAGACGEVMMRWASCGGGLQYQGGIVVWWREREKGGADRYLTKVKYLTPVLVLWGVGWAGL